MRLSELVDLMFVFCFYEAATLSCSRSSEGRQIFVYFLLPNISVYKVGTHVSQGNFSVFYKLLQYIM